MATRSLEEAWIEHSGQPLDALFKGLTPPGSLQSALADFENWADQMASSLTELLQAVADGDTMNVVDGMLSWENSIKSESEAGATLMNIPPIRRLVLDAQYFSWVMAYKETAAQHVPRAIGDYLRWAIGHPMRAVDWPRDFEDRIKSAPWRPAPEGASRWSKELCEGLRDGSRPPGPLMDPRGVLAFFDGLEPDPDWHAFVSK